MGFLAWIEINVLYFTARNTPRGSCDQIPHFRFPKRLDFISTVELQVDYIMLEFMWYIFFFCTFEKRELLHILGKFGGLISIIYWVWY